MNRISLLPYLGRTVKVVMDRPLGSLHPRTGMYYPINYGYLPDTISGDGQPIDAYLMGVQHAVESYVGVVIAVIVRRDDKEDKLVVAPVGSKYDLAQIESAVHFTEQYFDSEIIPLT